MGAVTCGGELRLRIAEVDRAPVRDAGSAARQEGVPRVGGGGKRCGGHEGKVGTMKPEIKYSGALEATLGRSRRVRAFIAVRVHRYLGPRRRDAPAP